MRRVGFWSVVSSFLIFDFLAFILLILSTPPYFIVDSGSKLRPKACGFSPIIAAAKKFGT
ncbi:MAG: hypothetical protein QOE77_539 [Blastocatellia bacterium]|nr:hypothetical protein [Blastocatellia bacterium]